MKKILRTLFFLGVATALSACSDYEENETTGPATDKLVSIHFTAINPDTNETPESRTAIDIDDQTKRFVSRWDDQDRMAMYYACGDAMDAVAATYDATAKKFTAQLPDLKGAWNYMTFAPYFDQPLKADGTGFQAPFGNHRTQKGNNFNYLFDPLVLKAPISTTDSAPGKDDQGNELTFDLARLTSILKYEIRGGSDAIKALLLTADKTISSSYYYGSFDGTGSYALNNANEDPVESNVIAVTFEGAAPTAAELDAYFNLPPARYGSLQLDIITANNAMGTLTLTDPASADGGFVAGELYRLKANAPSFAAVAAPSFEWPGQDMDAVHDITVREDGALTYDAAITITAPAGIAGLWVEITSDVLNGTDEDGDGIKDGITKLDLFNETSILGTIPYRNLGLDCSTKIQYKKSTVFNITGLIPMINGLNPASNDLHLFEVNVTDLAGQTSKQLLTFRTPEPQPSVTYDNNANAWANTATVTVANVPATATGINVQYRRIGTTEWKGATGNGNGKWTISAAWTKVAENPDKWEVDNTTGIFAGVGYEYQLIFTDAQGNAQTIKGIDIPAIPGSEIQSVSDASLSCYTTENATATFWGSGNNTASTSIGKTDQLCTFTDPYACMAAQSVFSILAPGNLFTGTFDFTKEGFMGSSSYGTVGFGQKYDYKNARPTALNLTYKATFGSTWMTKWEDADHTSITSGQDEASIVVCIVNWENRHNVTSGNKAAPVGSWNPETLAGLTDAEKAGLIAYGVYYPNANTTTDTPLTIPLVYYNKDAAKPDGNYTLIISCATSRYGDYLNGTQNNLSVKDFRWVY